MVAANDAVWIDVLPNMSKFGPSLAKGAGAQSTAVGAATGRSFGKAMLAGVAVVAGGAVLATKALYNIGSTFKEVENTIRVGTGATGKSLDALTDSAKRVGTRVPADFKDVGTAIADVNTRLGHTGKPLEDISSQFLELSRITGTDVAANIENVSRVFGDWGVEADKQADSLDYLFKVSQTTGIGIDDLSKKVVQYGAPMRQFGFSFEESAALMGKWAKEGVNTETIMGGMRAGLGKLAKAGKDPVKEFGRISKAIKNAGSEGEATAIAIETFGQRAGPDLAAAVREGRFELDDLMGTLADSDETIMKAGKDTMTFTETWKLFKNQAMLALEPIATRVFDLLGRGMEWVNKTGVPAMRRFTKIIKDHSGTLKVLGTIVALGTTAWMAYRVTVLASTAASKVSTLWTTRQTVAQKALNLAMKMNPLGLVIAALTLLATGLVVAYKKSETFRKIVNAAWLGIKVTASTVRDWFVKTFLPLFTERIPTAFRRGVDLIGNAWDRIKAMALKPVNFVIQTVYNNGIKAAFDKVAKALGSDARLPTMSTIGGGTAARTSGRSAPGVNMAAAGGAGGIGSLVKTVGGKAWDWVKDKFMGPINGRLARVGSSPWAKMAASVGRKMAGAGLDKLRSIFSSSEGDGASGPMGKAGVVLPRGKYRIGMPYLGYPGHYGADYPAPTGTPVYSVANGVVSKAATMAGSYGKHVYVRHPGGRESRYAHLNAYNVRAGQQIRSGQQLGQVGSTGNSTGPHLHYEDRLNGRPRNPANLGIFDQGGLLKQGMLAYHAGRKPDRVLTDAQWSDIHRAATRGGGDQRPIQINMPATSTPDQAAAAAGQRVSAALSALGV